MSEWSPSESADLYNLSGWGRGLFEINEAGDVCMTPPKHDSTLPINLKVLADDLRRRGLQLPVLVRFTDIIEHRVSEMNAAFTAAIENRGYEGKYRPVFPIKVNPQSNVLHDVMTHGRAHHLGLEAGSKPELMIVLALMDDLEAPIICNGYKDKQYIRMALMGRQMGHNVIIVIEKPSELKMVLTIAAELGIRPSIGVRSRLSQGGKGHWQTSTGDSAKFGLSLEQLIDVVYELRSHEMLECLQLLHFHIGSQIPEISTFRSALREGARIYSELKRLGAGMEYMDVGGGLGVDYDGTASTNTSSMNYNIREYAHAVVGTLKESFTETGTPHPHIITEAGRSMVAHHSVLLVDVLGRITNEQTPPPKPEGAAYEALARPIQRGWEILADFDRYPPLEVLHDAQALRRDGKQRFDLGLLNLEERAQIERLYWSICTKVLIRAERTDARELEDLRSLLTDTYFCNFSVFQSTPDVWAIQQMFPILPIHRHNEEPTRRGILADLTCDSDGKITSFVGSEGHQSYLNLHELRQGEHYDLGIFMVGAYQEILGDLHNLFGDTHAVHVVSAPNRRGYTILHLDEGEIVEEVLTYVHHQPKRLIRLLRQKIEEATADEGPLSLEMGASLIKEFTMGLDDYTYLGG